MVRAMAEGLRVVGAGLPRTGTRSLRAALERLLGGTCYHMSTLRERGYVDVATFTAAARDEHVDWSEVFAGCSSAVDFPPSAFWRELASEYPRSLILLSERDSADAWWRSANATVLDMRRRIEATLGTVDQVQQSWFAMTEELFTKVFGSDWDNPETAKAGYNRWNSTVREYASLDRLLVWRPGDGWAPICAALNLPIPDEPFPHLNTTEEFRVAIGSAVDALTISDADHHHRR